jgi:hypothetical protein
MELTDTEREEFMALAAATYDPDLWDESDLPTLRAARAEHEKEQARERGENLPPVEQSTLTGDDEGGDSDPHHAADNA